MTLRQVELSVGGMTCASCSRRVEKSLSKLDGVSAQVNYATGEAYVEITSAIDNEQLIEAVERIGYTAVLAGKAVERYGLAEFRIRFLVSVVLAVPVTVLTMVPSMQFSGWLWVAAAMTIPIAVWAGWPFHRAAAVNLRHGQVTMDTLVSIGVAVSLVWSLWLLVTEPMAGMASMNSATMPYFDVAADVTTLVLLGKYLEHRARNRALTALESLASLNPQFAIVVTGDQHNRVPIENVRVDDIVFVRTGEQIPVDGVVIDGEGHVDSSLITGESLPIHVASGASVIGATVLTDGVLTIRAQAVGGNSVLAGISRLVHQAQSGKAEVTRLVDRVSAIFVPIVIGLAVATFVAWLVTGHSALQAMTSGIAVLVIACPCALGLATPTALLVGTGRGASLGIIVRGPHAIEASGSIDTMFLDKTGTITAGELSVVDVTVIGDEARMWRIVSALEQTSTHPIAQALVNASREHGADTTPAEKVLTVTGRGIQGHVDGHPATVGSVSWVGAPDGPLRSAATDYAQAGHSVVAVYDDARCIAVIALADAISADAVAAIASLRAMGIEPVIVSGDHEAAVAHVAAAVGINEYHAGCTPQEKVDLVASRQNGGSKVAMVGDGVNDAAALARVHLSMAMGAGADVAAHAADIVLMRSSLTAAVDALRLSRATMRTIKFNLLWAFGYNVAAIPLAMTGLVGPIVSAGTMAFSSVFVVTNSLRLRKFR